MRSALRRRVILALASVQPLAMVRARKELQAAFAGHAAVEGAADARSTLPGIGG
jgi:hypothetical protein